MIFNSSTCGDVSLTTVSTSMGKKTRSPSFILILEFSSHGLGINHYNIIHVKYQKLNHVLCQGLGITRHNILHSWCINHQKFIHHYLSIINLNVICHGLSITRQGLPFNLSIPFISKSFCSFIFSSSRSTYIS